MSRIVSGTLAVITAALLVCCSANPRQDQDVSGDHSDRYDTSGVKTRNLDALGGSSLVRAVRQPRQADGYTPPYFVARRFNSFRHQPVRSSDKYHPGEFDEIDTSSLNFVKRNFDEIDQSSMPFPYGRKRFYPNFYEPLTYDYNKRPAEYPMDEIDLSRFPLGSKRSSESYPLIGRMFS